MSIIKNLKGYIRRLSTPKKENIESGVNKPALQFNILAGVEIFQSGYGDGYFLSVIKVPIDKDTYTTHYKYLLNSLEKCQMCNIKTLIKEDIDNLYFYMAGYSHDFAELILSLRTGTINPDTILDRSICGELEQIKSVWWNIYGSTSEYIDVDNNFITEATGDNIYPLKYLTILSIDIMKFFGGVIILEKYGINFISFNSMRFIVSSKTFRRNFTDYIEKFKNILEQNNIVLEDSEEESSNTFDSDIDEII